MFFKRNTKVLISSVDIASEADLAKLNDTNTHLVSGLSNIAVTTSTPPNTFSEGFNTINSDAKRGQYLEPGTNSSFTITLETPLALSSGQINNLMLWKYLLTSTNTLAVDSSPTILNNASTGQNLHELSIIVVSDAHCRIFRKAIVNTFDMQLLLSDLQKISWTLLAGKYLDLTGVYVDGSSVIYASTSYMVHSDSELTYIPGKTTLIRVGQSPVIPLACISGSLSIGNNAILIPSTGIDDYNSFLGYKLGTQNISGSVGIYLKVGVAESFIKTIANEHVIGSKTSQRLLTFVFPTAVGILKICVGYVYFTAAPIIYDNIFSSNLTYTALNYTLDDFIVSVE